MGSNINEAGKTYIANVSITEAVAFDPEHDNPDKPETWNTLEARDFDKDSHGHMKFFCPCCLDKGDMVKLKNPSGSYFQQITFDIVDRDTQEPVLDPTTHEPVTEARRYQIPPRYSLFPHEKHTCDLGEQQSQLSQSIKDHGGVVLNSATGTYIVNLNIPAGQEPTQRNRPRTTLTQDGGFNNAATNIDTAPARRQIHRSSNTPPKQHSHGVKTVQALADLLDSTEFDKGQRQAVLMRNGGQVITLEQAYHKNTVNMYRDLYHDERQDAGNPEKNHNHISLFRFRPNGIKKFWNRGADGSMSVLSHPEQVHDRDGNKFYVSTRLNFQTESTFEAFKEAYEAAETKEDRWFLIYSEHASVNLVEYDAEKQKLEKGTEQSADVHVTATIFSADQIMQWKPRSAQLMLNFDLGEDADAKQEPDPNEDDLSM
ncbi:MAG: hypothetical protein COA45_06350 [Zetaproteobacteria bacterium]|nr:MAG: hypothetical protein COA45_06350 [Zetaproteobacteria bacterium]